MTEMLKKITLLGIITLLSTALQAAPAAKKKNTHGKKSKGRVINQVEESDASESKSKSESEKPGKKAKDEGTPLPENLRKKMQSTFGLDE